MGNPDESYATMLQHLVVEQIRRNQAAIDEACIAMLLQVDTDWGVLVQDNPDGTVSVTLTPEVPYKQIHYRHTTGITYTTGEST